MFITKDSRDGIYYVIYKVNGKRKRKSLSTKDFDLAQKAFSEWKIRFENDGSNLHLSPANNSKFSIKELSLFVCNYSRNNFCKSTSALYERSFRILEKILGSERETVTLGINDLEIYKNECRKTLSSTTVNMQLRCIKAGFNLAIRHEIININPAKNVKQLNELQKEKVVIDKIDFDRLIRAIKNRTFKELVLFGYYTGCRSSEICNLQWNDINLVSKTILIKNKLNFKTKTGKIRKLPISDKLMLIISNINHEFDNNYIFLTAKGNPYNKDLVARMFRRYCQKANLPKSIHFHCLRHTFITELLRKGVSIYFVSKLAGHSSITTTTGYIHTDTDDYRTAINLL